MTRECTQCKTVKNLNMLNFLQGKNRHNTGEKLYFSYRCRKCHYKNEAQLRKDRRNVIKPSKGMHFIRQAVIGYKDEPYYLGEDFEYKAPTLEEVLNEYK